jgi:hypothetical protein
MLTASEEDSIAKLLSGLTPTEYSQLMKKVNRSKWEAIPSPSNSRYNMLSKNPKQK